jgi:hypothetical protein
VAKLKTELEKMVAALRDRIILAVDIPAATHGALIGRGGQHLNDMQNKYNISLHGRYILGCVFLFKPLILPLQLNRDGSTSTS